MSFKSELEQLYKETSSGYKEFELLINDLKREMVDASKKDKTSIHIDETHELKGILKHKVLLVKWCEEEGIYHCGWGNEDTFKNVTLKWIY